MWVVCGYISGHSVSFYLSSLKNFSHHQQKRENCIEFVS